MDVLPKQTDKFRDQIATAEKSGKRIWIFPTRPQGKLYRARTITSWFLLAFLFGTPLVRVGGQPLMLFNILERKFIIFGVVFWPQDFHLFVIGTIALVVFVILFTAVYGRLFCGWVCPQTIFMEMVFRKIEYLIEGNAAQQRRLAASAWDEVKLFKKGLKHALFLAISFIIGNTFLAWIIGTDQLREIVTSPPSEHLTGFVAMVLFSLVFYGVFARFREQVCTMVCPYGRLQSVLVDRHSIIVAYDHRRGEPRGGLAVGEKRGDTGHCIDCAACVKVCPTGIDIRNGTQLECVNCTACIDACDRVMHRVGLPPKLIRYTSEHALEHGQGKLFTGRVAIYSLLFTLLVSLLTILMVTRADVETSILRPPGMLYKELADGRIRNVYSLKVVNKTHGQLPIELKLVGNIGAISLIGPAIIVPADGLAESVFFIDIPADRLFVASTLLVIEVFSEGEMLEEVQTSFLGPEPKR